MARNAFTYRISSNGAAGDFYWEVARGDEILGRGLAATRTKARAVAMAAAFEYEDSLALTTSRVALARCVRR